MSLDEQPSDSRPFVRVRVKDGDEYTFEGAQFVGVRTGHAVIKKQIERQPVPQRSGLWSTNGSFSLHFVNLANIDRLEIGNGAADGVDTTASFLSLGLVDDSDAELALDDAWDDSNPDTRH